MCKKLALVSTLLIVSFCVAIALAAPQPIAYFAFDQLDGAADDVSGNGNDGTVMGDMEFANDGKAGGAFSFNGTDAYVEMQRVVQDDFTLMTWIKTDTEGSAGNQAYQGDGLIWSDVGGAANDFILAVLGPKASFFAGSPDKSVTSETDVITGQWVHLAATRVKGGDIAIYVDGKLEKSDTHGNSNPLDSQPLITIGTNILDRRFYTGLMDEVKIFDVVLTEGEIQEAMVADPTSVELVGKLAVTWGEMKSK